jgi:methylated-DNA-protein-cysteine methyltransferase related protein
VQFIIITLPYNAIQVVYSFIEKNRTIKPLLSLEKHKGVNTMYNEPSSTSEQAATLSARVFALVRACPVGRVTTYGALAKAVGYPRGARMVGWIMNESPEGVPAQRVINSKGELSGSWAFGSPDLMRQLLEAEGIVFSADGRVDLKRYGWEPTRDLSDEELQSILENAQDMQYEVSEKLLDLMRTDPASPLRGQPSS